MVSTLGFWAQASRSDWWCLSRSDPSCSAEHELHAFKSSGVEGPWSLSDGLRREKKFSMLGCDMV